MNKQSTAQQLAAREMVHVRTITQKLLRRLPSRIMFDDLYAVGLEALVAASHRFDQKRGVDFRAYAQHRVYGALLDELRRLDMATRKERTSIRYGADEEKIGIPREVDLAAAESVIDPTPTPDDNLDRRRVLAKIPGVVMGLPPRKREIFRLYFEESWTLRQIAERFGITEARVCQLKSEITSELRRVADTLNTRTTLTNQSA